MSRYLNDGDPRRKKIIISVVAGVVLVIIAVFLILSSGNSNEPEGETSSSSSTSSTTTTTLPPEPDTDPNPLTGVGVSPDVADRQPISVVIDNHPDARPQSGISRADLVVEVVAEGGITRFMAIFLAGETDIVGPVRSAREYFAEISHTFDAAIAHVGGSPSGYDTIRNLGVDDLDQMSAGNYFWRDRSRRAPHNAYSSTADLRRLMDQRNYTLDKILTPFKFKDDADNENFGTASEIRVEFSRSSYNVIWTHDPETNTYARNMGGVSHMDTAFGEQVTAKNIMVMFTTVDTFDAKGRVHIGLDGTGNALVFRDGDVIEGTWHRNSDSQPIEFKDTSGNTIPLNRGNSWLEITETGNSVDY